MSIYKRASGKYAVLIDAEGPHPFRVVVSLPKSKNGRRRMEVIAEFRTGVESEKHLLRLKKTGDTRQLSVERLARGRRSLGTFATKREAERAERDALSAKDRGIDIDPSKLTMNALFERFIESRESSGKSGTTIYEYRRKWDLYCERPIGTTLARELKKIHLATLYSNLRRRGGVTADRCRERPFVMFMASYTRF